MLELTHHAVMSDFQKLINKLFEQGKIMEVDEAPESSGGTGYLDDVKTFVPGTFGKDKYDRVFLVTPPFKRRNDTSGVGWQPTGPACVFQRYVNSDVLVTGGNFIATGSRLYKEELLAVERLFDGDSVIIGGTKGSGVFFEDWYVSLKPEVFQKAVEIDVTSPWLPKDFPLIGNSLSGCISDILKGYVKSSQIVVIITGTLLVCPDDFEVWLDHECRYIFKEYNRETVKAVLKSVQYKLYQPRIHSEYQRSHGGQSRWIAANLNVA